MTTVPAQYQGYVTSAATQLGLPPQIVAEQINLESGWNPDAVSPTGAQGLAQFEPGTWADYGSGSPFDPKAAFAAYVKYMAALLKQEGGDVRKALEAYNAGPGNLAAGAGYADTIITRAGPGIAQQQLSSVQQSGSVGHVFQDVTSGLITWPGNIIGFFADIDDEFTRFYKHAALFFQPSTYVRIGAGLFGALFIVLGIVCLAREAGKP